MNFNPRLQLTTSRAQTRPRRAYIAAANACRPPARHHRRLEASLELCNEFAVGQAYAALHHVARPAMLPGVPASLGRFGRA